MARKKRIKQIKGRQLGQIHTFARNAVRVGTTKKVGVASLRKNYSLTKSDAEKVWDTAKHYVAKESKKEAKE